MAKPNDIGDKGKASERSSQIPEETKRGKQAELQFESIVQSSNDAIISESLDGMITLWNPAAERIFGYTKEEAIGQPMSMIGPKEKETEFQELLDKVKKGETIQQFKTKRKRKDGTLVSVSVSISPIKNSAGKVIGLSAIDRDISGEIESSQYARSLIEASVDPLVTISPEGKITDVNDATMNATGATREELIGSRFSDYFTEPEKAEAGYKRVLKESTVRNYPLTIKNKDGKLMDVLYNASIFKDAQGNVLGVFAAARDITEQKQASQYARSLIEASLDPLVTISPDGKITDVNDATMNATGATREELIGSRFSDYFTEPEKAEEGYQTVLEKGSVSDYALTIKHRTGRLMDVLYNASIFKDAQGDVLGVFAAARDVTKTKQASEYTRSLIEASVDPLVTISPGGKITDVNEATVLATGVTRKELIGTNFSDYFTEPAKADAGYQKVLAEGSVKDYPLTIRHKDGKLTEVSYNASIYKDTRGNVIGVFAAARDITKQKQASQYARSLIEASLDPLVTISTDGKITDVNKATVTVTGVPRRELIGSDFSLYFTEPGKARDGYQQAFKKGEVRDYLLTIRSRLGKETAVLYNASVYRDSKGKVLGVFAAAREIGRAELKAARARELQRTSKEIVFRVALSYKMGKGSIKLNEKDAGKVGLGMVDDVTIRPTRQEISGKRVSAMSITSSRIQEGTVVMSVKDARDLGLEDQDTVHIIQAGVEESEDDEESTVPFTPAPAPEETSVTASESPIEAADTGPTKAAEETEETDTTVAEETEETASSEEAEAPEESETEDEEAIDPTNTTSQLTEETGATEDAETADKAESVEEQATEIETEEGTGEETMPAQPEEVSEGDGEGTQNKEGNEEANPNNDVLEEERTDPPQKPKELKQSAASKKAFEDKIDALRNSP